MKLYVWVSLVIALALSGCKKDKNDGGIIIPPNPVETAPVTGDTKPSSAGIVYRTLNMKVGYHKNIFLDANADGIIDISFSGVLIMHDGKQHLYLSAYGKTTGGNKLFVKKGEELVNGGLWAYPFNKDEDIEPTAGNEVKFTAPQQKASILSIISTGAQTQAEGLWANKSDKYLGFALKMNGEPHFGWIKISHDIASNEIIVSEYAYSKIPGGDIIAGEK
ncbi:hypothetical protein GWR56_05320 [Mucilaginibacter sp. 14171R-50]|uniref:hypothetical protein n=1 Tax=Mucilaginibacter sp. 14171R-50 TaxID=2703789 RepID=UPI00138C7291|nr:hypothetical protein [Mucilaginibacter sp. 14171R-50]QHS54987.1 hypothetical protein GWR56_05320 [Mucilaginibacter sp. 14171R-50]